MSDKAKKTKKEAPKKDVRKPVEPTAENVKRAIEECRVADISLPAVRKLFSATWKESVAIRAAALKALKS